MTAKWKKSPPELIARFDAALKVDGRIERRQMFGFPCAFLNGHMLTGLFQDSMMVRLSEADRIKAMAEPGASTFEPMKGRPMREYVVLPPAIVADTRKLRAWLRRAIAHVDALPAKKPKQPKKPKRG